ncbi:M3 family metallopeptidase [Gracilimonas mengyeensis]|uniref:Peptidyl-dipeptidase Dcp Metallo peptidase. MEROPS family M03A n=1 Tax=Gracilimonas mengyeensis TaxID=1302730 RepID=A0A521D5X0_9BACT|nr:M3 family metallopeptidase [Gracilimonas mengyeensis]SMO67103.1 peptidyl-dipeptidase Dcp Metallo peptidase. MEROPS family M03A [Gracilimonas mengyeensis]
MTEAPFQNPSSLPFEAPDFSTIENEHFKPAFEEGMKIELEEIKAIAENPEAPTFENTIVALEKTGQLLNRAQSVFYNLTSAHINDTLQQIQSEMAPKFSAHFDNILLNKQLFQRIETLHEKREELGLDGPSRKLLEDAYRDFVRAGAKLNEKQKTRIREINERISSLTTDFQEKLLDMNKTRVVVLDDEEELAGLSDARIAAAKEAAEERGMEGKYLLTISNTTRVPVLASLENRSVRQRLWEASANRGVGENGGVDTQPIILELVKLRAERARLLGYDSHAAYVLEDQTAQTPERALDMLSDLVDPVLRNSAAEQEKITQKLHEDGIDGELEPWDWEYYAEQVRSEEYDIDETEVRGYFELDRVLKDGVFYTMNKLFGITFKERYDLPVYHPDVRVFDVLDEDGEQIGLFYGDYFARDSKRGGAWMSSFVSQSHLLDKKPVIVNVLNIDKPAKGEPALISFDNVTTLFHEMGHGVHGLLSDVKYPSQSGTSVPRDFVEFPSTFEEDWAIQPEILQNYAIHHETGKQIPQELLDKVIAAQTFNQGFDTQEYLAAALLDMEWHQLTLDDIPTDVQAFEKTALGRYNMDSAVIPPRYKSPYFAHVFSGGYAAGYYAYIWSEVLAADAFAFMKANGGAVLANGNAYREHILSKGGSEDPMQLYRRYRGQEPDVKHLLLRRGLDQ